MPALWFCARICSVVVCVSFGFYLRFCPFFCVSLFCFFVSSFLREFCNLFGLCGDLGCALTDTFLLLAFRFLDVGFFFESFRFLSSFYILILSCLRLNWSSCSCLDLIYFTCCCLCLSLFTVPGLFGTFVLSGWGLLSFTLIFLTLIFLFVPRVGPGGCFLGLFCRVFFVLSFSPLCVPRKCPFRLARVCSFFHSFFCI